MVGGTHSLDTRLILTTYNQWPIHMYIQHCGIQPRHWLAWIPAGCIVHLRNISVARQHGMVFLCTQLNSLVDVLKVYIRTAVSVPQVYEVSG